MERKLSPHLRVGLARMIHANHGKHGSSRKRREACVASNLQTVGRTGGIWAKTTSVLALTSVTFRVFRGESSWLVIVEF